MKQLRFLFICLFWSSILAIVCKNIYSIYWGYVYDLHRDPSIAICRLNQIFDIVKDPHSYWLDYWQQSFLRGSYNLLALASLVMLAQFWHRLPKSDLLSRNIRKYQFNRDFLVDIRRSFRYVEWLARGVIFATGTVLVLLIADPLQTIWTFGIRDLAYAADGLGSYEFGEQIYSLANDSKGTTLASTCGIDGHDSNKKELESGRLNKKVEATYGPLSLQMAHRYCTLGNHYFENFDDNLAAERYRLKAIHIYKHLDRRIEVAQQLSFVAFCQADRGCTNAARKSINESLYMLQIGSPTVSERQLVLFELNAAALAMGDKNFSTFFLESKECPWFRAENSHVKMKLSPVRISEKIVMLVIVLILLREGLFSMTLAYWKKELQAATETRDKSRLLTMLVNLELARNDLDEADYYSRQLLQVAAS